MLHNARDLIQRLQWQFGIGVDEPKNLPVRGLRPSIHLDGPTPSALHKLITKSPRKISRAIGTFTVGNYDLGFGRSLAQTSEKRPYQRRLVENRNDNRYFHSTFFGELGATKEISSELGE
jgi:hypothetical protein